MHDALRMNNYFYSVIRQAEQEVRLDYLERLVGQSRAVDRDLSAHSPGWMPQGVLDSGRSETRGTPVAERAARRRENHPSHLRGGMPGDALEDRAVLAVDGDDFA